MDCAEAKLQIESYVAGQLSAGEKKALDVHLADCAECRLDSELTRASKSAPTRNLPPAAPPEAAARPSAGEWTIESIFGSASGSGAGSAATAAAPASAPASGSSLESGFESGATYRGPAESGPVAEPDVPLPQVLQGPAPAAASAEPPREGAGNGAPGWQFEPADQKQEATPPEGSLFFAEEALSRTGTPAKAKSSLLRVVMWGVGGVVGLGLLGVSIWFALTLKPPAPHDSAMLPNPGVPAAQGPGPGETSATADPAGETPATEHAPETVAPEPAPPPVETALSDVPRAGRAVKPPPQRETRTEITPPKLEPATPRPADPAPSKQEPAPPRPAPAEERPLWEPAIREEAYVPPAPPPAKPRPASPTPDVSPSSPPAASDDPPPATVPRAQTPAVWPKSAPGLQPPPETTPAADPIQRPIDRLHLATLAAEQNADLPALQKLRDTWRSFLRTSIGPDRARAKRELGDCLWAIQTLTTRTSDQKAALVAYRDYLLNAPAGGADARTVARMRQLEDALAESR
jgi:hypothetical protein